jgi:endonuclease-3
MAVVLLDHVEQLPHVATVDVVERLVHDEVPVRGREGRDGIHGAEVTLPGVPARPARRQPRRRITAKLRERAGIVLERLKEEYPEARCALDHASAYQLLVATILSAQCTDERVNMVTPVLFRRYPTPADLAAADPEEVERIIQSTGFFRQKTRSLIGMARDVSERYGGDVPVALHELTTLSGVGRKTGNVVRSVAYDEPGLPVDTHVTRLSNRLALTREKKDAVKIEHDLMPLFPPEEWGGLSLRLIEHGRKVCVARRPRCEICVLNDVCPSSLTLP